MSNTKKIKVKKKKEEEKVDSLTLMVRDSLGSVGRSINSYQEKLLVQLIKVFLVGGLSTIIDLILYFILYHFVKMNPLIANSLSFVVILIFGYFMSLKYVFTKTDKKNIREYFILSIVGLLVTEGLLFGLVSCLSWNAMLIKIFAVILVIIIKILLRKFVLSKK